MTKQTKPNPLIMKAIWKDQVLAESDDVVEVEGNYYFPISSIKTAYFKDSQRKSTCPWKGEASYYDVDIDGQVNEAAAWFYPAPKPDAQVVKDRISFWKGVRVE